MEERTIERRRKEGVPRGREVMGWGGGGEASAIQKAKREIGKK